MNKNDIQQLVKSAVTLGRIEILETMMPNKKWISKPQVLDYLKFQGIQPRQLKIWEDNGLLQCHQTGTGGTRKYSRSELQTLIVETAVRNTLT